MHHKAFPREKRIMSSQIISYSIVQIFREANTYNRYYIYIAFITRLPLLKPIINNISKELKILLKILKKKIVSLNFLK